MPFFTADKSALPSEAEALPGRAESMPVAQRHAVHGGPMRPPWPAAAAEALFGMGCFWGAERVFWTLDGVISTQVGYAAGVTPNPTYQEVCSGRTGHNEVVRVIFDAQRIGFDDLLRVFWERHDPTQGMGQGADRGTQYRSGVYVHGATQRVAAESSRALYGEALSAAGLGAVTTEILDAPPFFYAEDYHQQYLHKNPAGYCGIGGTGVRCPEGGAA